MNEKAKDTPARVGRGPKLSAIWLVPIVGAVIGMWMVYYNWVSRGPVIEITFLEAEGIEAGKTKVKMKNVEIGQVLQLRLSEDAEYVILSVRIRQGDADLLREDSKFWVVRPRIGTEGISGLGTIISGGYIEMSPGTSEETSDQFEGLETPPVTPVGTPGVHVTLDSAGDRALKEGDRILFNGMEVGKIEYVHFNSQERRTYYNAFVATPFDRLITTNTRFWFSSGVRLDLSAEGLQVEMSTLASIISGSVSFGVPEGQPLGDRITTRAFFTIYPRESAIYEELYEYALQYVLLFEESIRGLKPGAPVEYRGVKVGEVMRTDIKYSEIENLLDPGSRIPVLIEIEPARLGFADSESALQLAKDRIEVLITNGLHAELAMGNLLTGQKLIALKHQPGTGNAMQTFGDYTIIPSIAGPIGQLLANASGALDTINELPLNKTLDSATLALQEITGAVSELEEILANPSTRDLVETLNSSLASFQQLAIDFSAGSATHRELQQSLTSLEQTLNELEPVLRNLRRRPNSLVFGGSDGDDLVPQGAVE